LVTALETKDTVPEMNWDQQDGLKQETQAF
jgi:hypothetical protein